MCLYDSRDLKFRLFPISVGNGFFVGRGKKKANHFNFWNRSVRMPRTRASAEKVREAARLRMKRRREDPDLVAKERERERQQRLEHKQQQQNMDRYVEFLEERVNHLQQELQKVSFSHHCRYLGFLTVFFLAG